MRLNPTNLWDIWRSGTYVANQRPHGRVTFEPNWTLTANPTSPSAQFAGPSRYWRNFGVTPTEVEIPNLESISTDFDIAADSNTCRLVFKNTNLSATPAARAAVPTIVASLETAMTNPAYLDGAVVGGDLQMVLADADADTIGTTPTTQWSTPTWWLYAGPHGGDNTTVSPLYTRVNDFYVNNGSLFDTTLVADGIYTLVVTATSGGNSVVTRATFEIDNSRVNATTSTTLLNTLTTTGPQTPTLTASTSSYVDNGQTTRSFATADLGANGRVEFIARDVGAGNADVLVFRHNSTNDSHLALVCIDHGAGQLWFVTDERQAPPRDQFVTNFTGNRNATLTVLGGQATLRIQNSGGTQTEFLHTFELPAAGTGTRWGTARLPRYSSNSNLQTAAGLVYAETDASYINESPTNPRAYLASGSDPDSLGQPGYLSPTYGETNLVQNVWGQTANAFATALTPNSLLRTYEGYGGNDLSITDAVTAGNLALSGTWLVDDVVMSGDGKITVTCRDMHKLLVDQVLIPELVPSAVYPPNFRRYSDFTDVSDREQGVVRARCVDASTDVWYGRNAFVTDNAGQHRPTFTQDGQSTTYWLSREYTQATGDDAYPWLEYDLGGTEISSVTVLAQSAYRVLVSVLRNGVWTDTGTTVPYVANGNAIATAGNAVDTGAAIPYIVDTTITAGVATEIALPADTVADRVRLTFTNLTANGAVYTGSRALVWEVTFDLGSNAPVANTVAVTMHPTRLGAYAAVTDNGVVYVFGNATSLGDLSTTTLAQPIVDIEYNNDGSGYWLVAADGGVFTFGTATFYGAVTDFITTRTDIVTLIPTRTGAGYWIIASNGDTFAFGDAQSFTTPVITTAARDLSTGGQTNGAVVVESSGTHHTIGGGSLVTAAFAAGDYVGIHYNPTNGRKWGVTSTGTVVVDGGATNYGDLGGADTDIVDIVVNANEDGYWLVSALGEIYAFGNVTASIDYESGLTGTPVGVDCVRGTTDAFWMVTSTGEFFAFQGAAFIASPVISNIVSITKTRTLDDSGSSLTYGYYLLGSDGGVETRGEAPFYGTVATHGTNPQTISNAVALADRTTGYWIFADDGTVWNFGASVDYGNIAITSPLADAWGTGDGYWALEANGGVHARGTLPEFLGAANLNSGTTAVAICSTSSAYDLYWVIGSDGEVYSFGTATEFPGTAALVPAGRTVVDATIGDNTLWGVLLLDNGALVPFGETDYTSNPTSSLTASIVGAARSESGFRMVGSDGRVYNYNTHGATAADDLKRLGVTPDQPIVDIGTANTQDGYILIGADGGTFNFGTNVTNTAFGTVVDNSAVAIDVSDDGNAAYVLESDGTVIPLGTGTSLSNPQPATTFIDGSTDWDNDAGFYLLDANGDVIPAFNSVDYGSYTGGGTAQGIDSIAGGYAIVGSGGVVQTFGTVTNQGDESATVATDGTSIVDIGLRSDNNGYVTIAGTGQVYASGTVYNGNPFELLNAGLADGTISSYEEIIRILLCWSGQWAFPNTNAGEPDAWAFLEPTGTYPAQALSPEMFSKRPVMDAINEIAEGVGYSTFCNREGKSYFLSPNRWTRGNFDHDTDTHTTTIPILDDRVNLINSSISLPGAAVVSEIIVATVDPTVTRDATRITRLTPNNASDMRGIQKPLVWVNSAFTDEFERGLMADLVGLQLHFRQRTGSFTIPGTPLIDPDDQVQIIERNSASVAYHYVTKVTTELNVDSGSYQTTLTTHWLGDTAGWVADSLTLSQRTREYLTTNSRAFNA